MLLELLAMNWLQLKLKFSSLFGSQKFNATQNNLNAIRGSVATNKMLQKYILRNNKNDVYISRKKDDGRVILK